MYKIIRKKRKNLTLKVENDGTVVVLAPPRASIAQIDRFVARNLGWIRKKQEEIAALPRFEDGDAIEICGRRAVIRSGARAMLDDGELYLPRKNRTEALAAFLKRATCMRMEGLLACLCAAYGFSYAKLRVTSARSRWGSCGANGTISFTFRAALLPDALAEYLAVHELCHTRHLDHSAAFWNEVRAILPDYLQRRHALKQYLWAMRCF